MATVDQALGECVAQLRKLGKDDAADGLEQQAAHLRNTLGLPIGCADELHDVLVAVASAADGAAEVLARYLIGPRR